MFEAVGAIVPGLQGDEPSLTFIDAVAGTTVNGASTKVSSGAKEISVDTVASVSGGTLDEIYLAGYSKSGTCFHFRHLNATGANGGTFIASAKVASTACSATDGEALAAGAWKTL